MGKQVDGASLLKNAFVALLELLKSNFPKKDLGKTNREDDEDREKGDNRSPPYPPPCNGSYPPHNAGYAICFEFQLKEPEDAPDTRYKSDAVQFKRANDALIKQLNDDENYRNKMFDIYPGLKEWYTKKPVRGSSPPGLTWHHCEEPGKPPDDKPPFRLLLVDRVDHSRDHKKYHRNEEGKGGRSLWGGGKDGRTGKLDGKTGELIVNK